MAPPILSEMKSSSLPAPDSPIQYGNISRALGIFSWSIALLLLCLAPTDLEQSSAAGTFIILLGFIILVVASLNASKRLMRGNGMMKRKA
jgi:CHASE1-domain containing sensor protein